MKRTTPRTDRSLQIALDRAAAKAPEYAAALKLTPEMVAERIHDAAAFGHILSVIEKLGTCSKDWTAFKSLLLKGQDSGATIPFPLDVVFGTAPATVSAGISRRYSRFAAHCKLQTACTENVAIDLGIAGSGQAVIDLDSVQPVIKLIQRPDGVFVDWSWDGLAEFVDTIELRVDRGDGQGERSLIIDSTPGYLDAAASPAALARWTYRGIWRIGENQVGLWSVPVSIVVGG